MDFLFHPPVWFSYLMQGIFIFVSMASSAIVLTRAGRSPWYAFLMLMPFIQIIALWLFAYTPWPKKDK